MVGALLSRDPRSAEAGTQQPPMGPRPVAHGRDRPPGPTRRFDRRHFARMESGGALALAFLVLIALWTLGVLTGLLPDIFRWER